MSALTFVNVYCLSIFFTLLPFDVDNYVALFRLGVSIHNNSNDDNFTYYLSLKALGLPWICI